MANGNTVTIVGNLTRDPELRYTPTGVSKAQFGVAVNRRWRNDQNEWEEETSFFTVVCWRELADNVGASLHQGDRVIVTGRLQQRTWETEEGDRRSVVEIVADEVGPSLRWARAEIDKPDRRPAETVPAGGTDAVPAGAAAGPATYDGGEEPF